MSGICGIIHQSGEPVREDDLRAMLEAASHRGPDGVFSHIEESAAFGYLSLEITPESEGERQPVVHPPTGVIITASLRLDNRDELMTKLGRERVERERRSFTGGAPDTERPPTDTELVLVAYLTWGEACCEHLLGDFALAVRDPRSRRLLLARDPMGMRPLYYRVESRRLAFGSEVKQMLALPGVERRINEAAVAAHLIERYDMLESTFYTGIAQVPPGTRTVISDSGVRTQRFREINPDARLHFKDDREYAEQLRELFLQAVACRMRTRKTTGISLSGGMDSGSVAAAVGWLKENGRLPENPEFRAYTHAFSELKECDERENSARITDHYRIPAIDVPADEAWTLADYPDHGPDEDGPFLGVYQCLIERVLTFARRDDVRLLLTGARGDLMLGVFACDLPELFFERRFPELITEMRYLARRNGLLRTVKKLVKPTIKELLPDGVKRALGKHPETPQKTSADEPWPPHLSHDFIRSHSTPPAEGPALKFAKTSLHSRHRNIFDPLYMTVMIWAERTYARQGMEFADPFSDRRLAEYMLAIPQTVVHRLAAPKCLLRASMHGIMPAESIQNARKISPEPLYRKGTGDRASDIVLDLFTNSEAARRGYINEPLLKQRTLEALKGKDTRFAPWPILSLEMWLRRYWK